MSRLKEAIAAARQRVNPDGFAASLAISPIYSVIGGPIATGIAFGTHEVLREVDPELLKYFVIGILGAASLLSVVLEAKALELKKYCASPVASTIYGLTGNSVVGSSGGHFINLLELSAPSAVANMLAALTENDTFIMESLGTTAFVWTTWFITMNTLVLSNKIDPVANGIKKVRKAAEKSVKKTIVTVFHHPSPH
ncbi:MAG: hypothetical protein HYT83_01195 [Candidatus Levybacteria bacterium]|nr:hypothetical protein [Candidatus Levybacteria bacterium]